MMNKTAAVIIANAIIWGVVLITVASVLKGTEYSDQVRNIIAGGAGGSLLVVGGLTARKK
jgi:hypothetical protein